MPSSPIDDPTAVGGRRLLACAIDVGLLVVLYAVVFVLLSRRAPVATWVGRSSSVCDGRGIRCASFGHRYVDGVRRFALQLVALAYLVGVFVLQRGWTGSTLGTRLLGIVTVGADGRPIGAGRALLRSVAGIVDYLPCCLPLVGIVTIFSTKGHRRVGDMAAHSLVVDRPHLGSPILVPGLDDPSAGVTPTPVPAPAPPAPAGPPSAGPGGPAAWSETASAGPADAPGATAVWPAAADTPGWAAADPPVSPPTAAASPASSRTRPPVPPAASAPPPGTPSATPPPPADPTRPQWDARRGAYIQWDQVGQRWMQFDQDTQSWGPI